MIYLQEVKGKYSNLSENGDIEDLQILRLLDREWDIVEQCWKYVFEKVNNTNV